MTYKEYQQYCARMGHIYTPLSEEQFDHCVTCGVNESNIHEVGLDVSSGISFDAAVSAILHLQTKGELSL
jgi:hypothetical protein